MDSQFPVPSASSRAPCADPCREIPDRFVFLRGGVLGRVPLAVPIARDEGICEMPWGQLCEEAPVKRLGTRTDFVAKHKMKPVVLKRAAIELLGGKPDPPP